MCVCVRKRRCENQQKKKNDIVQYRDLELIECLEHGIKMFTTIMANNNLIYRERMDIVHAYIFKCFSCSETGLE